MVSQRERERLDNNDNNNDFISIALFHVRHAQYLWCCLYVYIHLYILTGCPGIFQAIPVRPGGGYNARFHRVSLQHYPGSVRRHLLLHH